MPFQRFLHLLCAGFLLLSSPTASERGGGAIGWRHDGTGRYPDCQPPTDWDVESGKGVRWRVTLPGSAKSSPLVWGRAVIVTVDFDTVLAFELETGEELWRRELALDAIHAELAGPYREAITALRESMGHSAKQVPKELKDQLKKLFDKRSPLTTAGILAPTDFGWSMAGPVTDGESCYVRFGSGNAAALDRDGQVRWQVLVPQANGGEPFTLVDKSVVCTLRPSRKEERLVALRRGDGEITWTSEILRNPHDGWYGGGCTSLVLDGRELLVAHGGEVLDAASGALLATCAVEGNCRMSTPVAVADQIFFPVQPDHGKGISGIEAFRLSWQGEALQVEKSWATEPTGMETMTSTLWTGEHLMNVYTRQPYLHVFDPTTGALLNGDQQIDGSLRMGMHQPSPSPALAGGLIYAFDEHGTVLIAKPGARPELLAKRQLPRLHGSPFFVGRHLVALAGDQLLCVGP